MPAHIDDVPTPRLPSLVKVEASDVSLASSTLEAPDASRGLTNRSVPHGSSGPDPPATPMVTRFLRNQRDGAKICPNNRVQCGLFRY